jgi:putative peptidoglycan lipid II flippase
MSDRNKLIKSATIIVACTFISKILGLLRDSVTAAKFGTIELDAYVAASNLPMVLFIMIGAAITTTLIPLYNEKLKQGKKEACEFIRNVLNFFILVTVIISVVCVIFINPIVSLLNPGFTGAKLQFTKQLTIILIPTLIVNAVLYIFNAMLQSENNFAVPALVALPFNVIIIGYLFIYGKSCGVMGFTIITLIATAIQILPQMPYVKKIGLKYSFKINFRDPMLKRMCLMLIPVILGTGVQQINTFVERGVATNYREGSLTALTYGYRVFALFVDIFVVAISTVIYPKMARQTANNEIKQMKTTLSESICTLIVVILPMSLIVMIQSRPIIYILFQRGAFTSSATDITSSVLCFYSLGLLAFGLRDFVCKAYYTLQDTRTPMINSAISLVLNVVLIFIYKSFLGLKGLALANASSMYIACALLIYSLIKKIGSINGKKISITVVKTLIASAVMLIAIYYSNNMLVLSYVSTVSIFIKILISSLIGIVLFIITAFILRMDEVIKVKEMIMFRKSV